MKTEYKIGDIIEGQVTGIQSYGVFVSLCDDEQGLVHISECKHGYMTELEGFVSIGDQVKVMIIDIDEYTKKISLSMRVLDKLNTPPFPARIKRRRKRYLPNIGFQTLQDKMPIWIDQAVASIEADEYDIKYKV
ncbi:CvfD/Ygs/GSP13 family RNA-binding post-transcriptional regulator [Vaginisenegalia massiliensis]|uniref:CvfD/Ygs/GSP13 family RNA-binding post-transcriptional regulator n=1 Tax=Vaginisenegalia massiliensis TaxID=2058294 RepID=UPI000F5495C9|nr:CvfD/Ygs/GSP13 family RNA-binding post-transcriptional regulator [Vaginisenegalia massiliensis]